MGLSFWQLYPKHSVFWHFPLWLVGTQNILSPMGPAEIVQPGAFQWFYFLCLAVSSHACTGVISQRLKGTPLQISGVFCPQFSPLWCSAHTITSGTGLPTFWSLTFQSGSPSLCTVAWKHLPAIGWGNQRGHVISFSPLWGNSPVLPAVQSESNWFMYFIKFSSCVSQGSKSNPLYSTMDNCRNLISFMGSYFTLIL